MRTVLIIGYGNPLRSDDSVGWRVAEELSRTVPPLEVEVFACHQLTPDLADIVRQRDTIIFVDATQDGEPGEITCKRITPEAHSTSFSHELSPAALLEFCEKVFHETPTVFMVSLCGERFDHGEVLSPKVSSSIPRLIALVSQLASSHPNSVQTYR